jgi:hypothetical protein
MSSFYHKNGNLQPYGIGGSHKYLVKNNWGAAFMGRHKFLEFPQAAVILF